MMSHRTRVESTYRPETVVPPPPWGSEGPIITRVRTLVTAPEGVNLVVVIVETSEPGLVGYGCATFTQRAFTVVSAIEDYIAPLVTGRDVHDITDLQAGLTVDSYWRGGPVLGNAISGVDMALWDIKGKLAGMPVWQLLGGRVREHVECYVHASGTTAGELADQIERQLANGFRHVRCQVATPGGLSYGASPERQGLRWNPTDYVAHVPGVLADVRERVGTEVGIIHDIHERLSPALAVALVERLDPLGLLYVEDPLAPEDAGWLPRLRERTSSRIAFGELLTRTIDYLPLVADRLVDVVRCHVSALGGITPAWKLATLAETFGLQTTWHGPRDVSPIGHAANLAMEIASPATLVREHHEFSDAAREIFPGTPMAAHGVVAPGAAPGLGVDVDEKRAALHPPVEAIANWHYMRVRRTDGTVQRP